MYPAWLSAKIHLVPWTSCPWTLGTMGGWTLGTMSGLGYVGLEPPVFPGRGKVHPDGDYPSLSERRVPRV